MSMQDHMTHLEMLKDEVGSFSERNFFVLPNENNLAYVLLG
jgi:hypothetical protein